MEQDQPDDPAVAAVQRLSQVYEPIAVLRQGSEILIVARVGNEGHPALHHPECRSGACLAPRGPWGSLSDVAWALQAHQWHLAAVTPAGGQPRPAKTLAALLTARA